MTIEVATYIADFQPVNPEGTDPTSEGDNHIRLMKQVLQNSFPGATRAFQVPTTLSKTANYSIVPADGEGVIYVSTAAGAVTLTLPSTLTSADKGWKINFIKTTSDVNPVFVAPVSGTINSGGIAGLTQARRCIPGARSTAVWDGTAWFITRVLAVPIGSLLDYGLSALPPGYEWPSGQTLASAATNYPEYNAVVGSGLTPDWRGRSGKVIDNLGGTDATRLNVAGSSVQAVRTTVGGVAAGVVAKTLTAANIPAVIPTGTNTQPSVSFSINTKIGSYQVVGGPGATLADTAGSSGTTTGVASPSSVSVSGGGFAPNSIYTASPTALDMVNPTIMHTKILVVE